MKIEQNVAWAAAIWVEVFVYGIYTCLFLMALNVLTKRRSAAGHASTSFWIFLVATIGMFIIASLHVVVAMFRFTRAYVLLAEPKGPLIYLNDVTRWDFRANNVLLCLMTWAGDALVVYRCYVVWSNNFYIIALPSLLLAGSIGVNSFVLFWWDHPLILSNPANITLWLNAIFPLAFTQNMLTTGLISFKILSQYRASVANGVMDRSSRLTLFRILRIVVESAMIYTLQLLVLIILYFQNQNAQVIIQATIVPSIGIVFVLIAVRVDVARNQSSSPSDMSTLPIWLDRESAIEMHRSHVSFRGMSKSEVDEGSPTPSSYGGPKPRPADHVEGQKL